MPLILCIAFSLICAPAFILQANAEVLKHPEQIPEVVKLADTPHRGMSSRQVLAKFGEPVTRQAAVGSPPVSSWEYGSYSVYFENDFVLHTVVHDTDEKHNSPTQ
jgi:hypothetical protein